MITYLLREHGRSAAVVLQSTAQGPSDVGRTSWEARPLTPCVF